MSDLDLPAPAGRHSLSSRVCYWLAFGFVVVGLINAMPSIPGLDQAVASITDSSWLRIRRFPYEYFYPLAFVVMMLIVALRQASLRRSTQSDRRRYLGYVFDAALVVMALAVSLSDLNEIQSVCLTDQIAGDRARLIAEGLAIEKENAALERTVSANGCVAEDLPWLLQLIQNAAGDVGGAGWWAVLLLMGLLFLDPEMRAKPVKLVDALSEPGVLISTLYLMFLVVSIITYGDAPRRARAQAQSNSPGASVANRSNG